MKNIVRYGLTFALSFALAPGSVAPYIFISTAQAQGTSIPQQISQVDDNTRNLQQKAEAFATELEGSKNGSFPSHPTDSLSLSQQTMRVLRLSNSKYTTIFSSDFIPTNFDLSKMNHSLPRFGFDYFATETRIDKGNLIIQYRTKDKVYEHIFSGLNATAFAQDKEYIVFTDSTSQIRVIDLNIFYKNGFRSPIPVITVAQLPSNINPNDLDLKFQSRGLEPLDIHEYTQYEKSIVPLNKDGQPILTSGSLQVTQNQNGRSKLLAYYGRAQLETPLILKELLLSMILASLHPESIKTENLEFIQQMQNKTPQELRSAFESLAQETLTNPTLSDVINFTDGKQVDLLIKRIQDMSAKLKQTRDKYTLQEALTYFEKVRSNAQSVAELTKKPSEISIPDHKEILSSVEKNNFSNSWIALEEYNQKLKLKMRSAKEKFLTSDGLKYLKAVSIGTAATTASYLGIHALAAQGVAWAMEAANTLSSAYPDVLNDVTYRVDPLLYSILALSAFVPISFIVSQITGKSKGWDFKTEMASRGIKATAYLSFPFWHWLAKLVGQPNFFKSMRAGLNPFQKVDKNSSIGKFLDLKRSMLLGVGLPGLAQATGTIEKQNSAIDALAMQKARTQLLATKIAYDIVSESTGIDLNTLLLAEKIGSVEKLEREITTQQKQKFAEQWMAVSQEVKALIGQSSIGLDQSLSQIKTEDFLEILKKAQNYAEKIKTLQEKNPFLARLSLAKKGIWQNISKSVAEAGIERFYNLTANFTPSKFVANQTTGQFSIDYLFATLQMALWGARADRQHPEALTAMSGKALWTNPHHMTDMIDQVRIYSMNVPTVLALTYQRMLEISEKAYTPIENITLKTSDNVESFFKTMWNFSVGSVNLVQGKYGQFALKKFKNGLSLIQMNFLMVVLFRVFLAHQAPAHAVEAWLLWTMTGYWRYGWPWTPIELGVQKAESRFEERNREFEESKLQLSQSLRLGNRDVEAQEKFLEFFFPKDANSIGEIFKSLAIKNSQLPNNLRQALVTGQKIVKDQQPITLKDQEEAKRLLVPIVELANAIQAKDQSSIEKSYHKLKTLYRQ